MELERLVRVLRSRWGSVALISVIGFASAFLLTTVVSSNTEPVFEAAIAIEFELDEQESVQDLADEIESERSLAVFAAQDLLLENPGASIIADTASARLVFIANGSSPERARVLVESLVEAYLEGDPVSGGNINEQLDLLEAQAAEIQAEIDTLAPELTEQQQEIKASYERLGSYISRIEDQLFNLTLADAGADAEQRADNAARRADLETLLAQFEAERAALPPNPEDEPGLSIAEELRLGTLERRLEILVLDYQSLALRTLGVAAGGSQTPVAIEDVSPDPPNPWVNGVIGLFAGFAMALAALILSTRARKEVWLATDLPVPLLGVVPRRRISDLPGATWYDAAEAGDRKQAIQALRTAIEGTLQESNTALALVGVQVDSFDCHTLGVDVAAAFASAGRRVLLVDSDYGADDADLNEYRVGQPTLAQVLDLPRSSSSMLEERVSSLVDEIMQVRPGLSVMPSGGAPASPADALAATQFRYFLERTRATFDLVIFVAGAASSPAAQVVAQRLGKALVAVSAGRSTIPAIRSLMADFNTQGVEPGGAVMLRGTESVSLKVKSKSRSSEGKGSVASGEASGESGSGDHSPVDRLRFYPFPMEKGTGRKSSGSLKGLANDLAQNDVDRTTDIVESDEEFADSLLDALRSGDRADAVEPVAEYLVARVEDILTAVSGQSTLSDDLVEVATRDGYIPLTSVKGHRTVGEWLVEELRWELGDAQGDAVASEFVELLGVEGKQSAESLDSWLIDEFFTRHIERTEGEPEVWHLTSEQGTVQLLVYGRRLSRDRLSKTTTQVVRRMIDRYQRSLDAAIEADETDEVGEIEQKLRDLHLFEVALGMLQVGSNEEAKLNYPWRRSDQQPRGWVPVWAEGIRPNIAPLQRLDLLAQPVLTEDELMSTRDSA